MGLRIATGDESKDEVHAAGTYPRPDAVWMRLEAGPPPLSSKIEGNTHCLASPHARYGEEELTHQDGSHQNNIDVVVVITHQEGRILVMRAVIIEVIVVTTHLEGRMLVVRAVNTEVTVVISHQSGSQLVTRVVTAHSSHQRSISLAGDPGGVATAEVVNTNSGSIGILKPPLSRAKQQRLV